MLQSMGQKEPDTTERLNSNECVTQMTDENLLHSTERHSALCDKLNGEEIQQRGDVWTLTTDSLCCGRN